jgi:hypothetical protein
MSSRDRKASPTTETMRRIGAHIFTHKAFLDRIVDEGPIPAIHGVVRWRACDLIMRLHEEFGLSVSDDRSTVP